jgi:hypothetical protein
MSGAASDASAPLVPCKKVARLQAYGSDKNKTPAEILGHLQKVNEDARLVDGNALNP